MIFGAFFNLPTDLTETTPTDLMETVFPSIQSVQKTEITDHRIQRDIGRHPPERDHHDAVAFLDWLKLDPLLIDWQHFDPDM